MNERKYEERRRPKEHLRRIKIPFHQSFPICLTVNPGDLVMICGEVGSGKSSLLLTIATRPSRQVVAYCVDASVWLRKQHLCFQLSENITFGNPLDRHRYRKVIRGVHWILIWKTLLAIKWSLANSINLGGARHGLGWRACMRTPASFYLTMCSQRSTPMLVITFLNIAC